MSDITKERIELFIKNPLDNGLTRGERMELARIALASFEAEPVAYMTYKGYLLHAADPKLAEYSEPMPLYTAPQLPQPAVPNHAATAIRACLDEFPEDVRDIVEECASIAENACRSSMPQGSEQVTDNTNQQFESLSRGDK